MGAFPMTHKSITASLLALVLVSASPGPALAGAAPGQGLSAADPSANRPDGEPRSVVAARGGGETRLRLIDSEASPIGDAVVWFAADGPEPPPTAGPAVIDQVDKQFVPELTVIRRGTEVEFPNSDSVSHHVYSFAQPNDFELPLYRGDVRPAIRFEHVGIATLGCNIHDSMLGYIVVLDTSHYAITDGDGFAVFSEAPAPEASISVWSPRLDPSQPLLAELVHGDDDVAVIQVARRQRTEPRPFNGSLAWEEY